MEINKPTGLPRLNPYQQQIKSATAQQKKAMKRDQVQISAEAKSLLEHENQVDNRQEKINELKEKIESGRYQVDQRQLAEKIYNAWFN